MAGKEGESKNICFGMSNNCALNVGAVWKFQHETCQNPQKLWKHKWMEMTAINESKSISVTSWFWMHTTWMQIFFWMTACSWGPLCSENERSWQNNDMQRPLSCNKSPQTQETWIGECSSSLPQEAIDPHVQWMINFAQLKNSQLDVRWQIGECCVHARLFANLSFWPMRAQLNSWLPSNLLQDQALDAASEAHALLCLPG